MKRLESRPSLSLLREAAEAAAGQSDGEDAIRVARNALASEYGFGNWPALMTEAGNRLVASEALHEWFGSQLNNQVWAVIGAATVNAASPIDNRESLLYSAYASAHHWRQVGTAANRARAEHLISRAAVLADRPDVAVRHATRCLELVEAHPAEMEEWDLGFALEALARAQAAAGRTDEATLTLERAKAATAAISDTDDRSVIEDEFAREPWFGVR